MTIPYIISNFQDSPEAKEDEKDMGLNQFNAHYDAHIVTLAEASAGQAVIRIAFGGKKRIKIETMKVVNETNPYVAGLLGFHLGNFDMVLASDIPAPFRRVQYTAKNEIEASELYFIVYYSEIGDSIISEATWWSE